MIENSLVVVGTSEVLARFGLWKPPVKEALAVGSPLGRGELDPLQVIVQVFALGDVPDFPLIPVRASRRNAKCQQLSVLTHRGFGQGNGSVLGKRIGVKERPRLRLERVGDVEHTLILKSRIAAEKVASPFNMRGTDLFVIPQLRQSGVDRGALGNPLKERESDPV